MFKFSNILYVQGENESVTEKIISDRKITSEIWHWNRICSNWRFPKHDRTLLNEAFVISENPNITNEGNVTISPGKTEKSVSILSHDFYEEQTLPYLILKGKFGYNVSRDLSIRPTRYFN